MVNLLLAGSNFEAPAIGRGPFPTAGGGGLPTDSVEIKNLEILTVSEGVKRPNASEI